MNENEQIGEKFKELFFKLKEQEKLTPWVKTFWFNDVCWVAIRELDSDVDEEVTGAELKRLNAGEKVPCLVNHYEIHSEWKDMFKVEAYISHEERNDNWVPLHIDSIKGKDNFVEWLESSPTVERVATGYPEKINEN